MTLHEAVAISTDLLSDMDELNNDLTPLPNLPKSVRPKVSELLSQCHQVVDGLKGIALAIGAGIFPNTFQKMVNGSPVYRIVTTPGEETIAENQGFTVATFPETMTRADSAPLVVHSQVEKEVALDQGYTLPMG